MKALVVFVVLLAAVAVVLPLAAAEAPHPLASIESNVDGVTLDVDSVERKGSVLTVKWTVHNTGSGEAQVRFALVGKTVSTYVLDEENGTKYFVLTDKEGVGVASEHKYIGSNNFGIDETIAAGASKRFWMKLPAPPPEVHEVSLFFTDAEPAEGLAITDRG